MNIRSIIVRVIVTGVKLLDFAVPKDKKLLLFGSHSTKYVGGNSKALFHFINSLDTTPFHCYFVTKKPSDDYAYVHPKSLKFLKVFLRAKTILLTHGLGDMGRLRPSGRKNVIFLWHGQGPKADGYASRRFTSAKLRDLDDMMRRVTAFLTCSRLDSYIRAYDHALHPRQIQPLGFPRCDFLTDESLWKKKIPSLLSNPPEYKKVVLYAITWRIDGEGIFFPFDDFDVGTLEKWCASHGILLLIRSHINDNTAFEESLHVRNISFEVLNDITRILPEVDLLVTDYSSIQTDFLLLNR
ncbi:MAG: CDP-glycerol glycerophosphotransferase family protein, partial [Candidatus Thorarchaeota archaeon]